MAKKAHFSPKTTRTSFWSKLKALSIGILISVIVLEVFLRIWNPFGSRVKGDKIVLPAGMVYDVPQPKGAAGLDANIHHTKNSLGFRGPEKPADWEAATTVVAVGGSTTECFYLSDGNDWPAQLLARMQPEMPSLWINNAGLDGHSTFGHQVLLDDYVVKLKPDVVLFMVGVNDIGVETMRSYDADMLNKTGFKNWLVNHSAILSTISSIRRAAAAKNMGLSHQFVPLSELKPLEISADSIQRAVAAQAGGRAAFSQRVQSLLRTCTENGIRPVLITQALLWGDTLDPVTGLSLANVELHEGGNGSMRWAVLESYNDILRQLAREQGVPLIDLAQKMPKSTAYFYDAYHFTNAGGHKVAELLAPELEILLQNL
jgi:lysophospholipase L1-like esterase